MNAPATNKADVNGLPEFIRANLKHHLFLCAWAAELKLNERMRERPDPINFVRAKISRLGSDL